MFASMHIAHYLKDMEILIIQVDKMLINEKIVLAVRSKVRFKGFSSSRDKKFVMVFPRVFHDSSNKKYINISTYKM